MALVKKKGNNPIHRHQTILTKTLCRKYLLVASWLLMIIHIYIFWFAPDRSDVFIDDPSFGEPEIERSETRLEDDTSKDTIQRQMIEIEALQPVTFNKCCIPAAYKDTKPPNNHNCFEGTCYNERACSDTIYPFTSVDEKNMFPQAQYTQDTKKVLKVSRSMYRLSNSFDLSNVCYRAFQHVILFPSHKLAFCGIPKVGITQWEQFLRFYIVQKTILRYLIINWIVNYFSLIDLIQMYNVGYGKMIRGRGRL